MSAARRRRLSVLPVPPQCRELIERGALVTVSHSGGKTSQAMTILLSRIVPRDQLVVVHAPLAEVDWPGTTAHIENTIPPSVPLILARTGSGQCLLERIEKRGRFPDSGRRYCTSDMKRTPIERELRRYLKSHPHYRGRLVNAMGIRASESPARSKLATWRRSERNSRAGREWFDWLPIHALETADVFRVIREAGQSPHWAYAAGMSRLSCSFCILASRADLRRAAELRPDLYRTYVELEQRIGHTLSPTRVSLPALTSVPVRPADGTIQSGECNRVRVPALASAGPQGQARPPARTRPVRPEAPRSAYGRSLRREPEAGLTGVSQAVGRESPVSKRRWRH